MSGSIDDPQADPPPDVHVRAGEYVLGVLDAAEAASVRREAMVNLDLADAIVRWEVRFASLGVIPALPPPELWARIEAGLGAGPGAVAAIRHAERTPTRPGWWRATAVAALALAAAFAAVAFLPRPSPPSQVAALVAVNAPAPAFLAQVRGDGTVLVTAFAPAAVPTSRDLQLWLVPPGATRPISLGVLPASGRTVVLPGPPQDGAQLLVSLEPQGGSPTGLPTGPVLYGGALRGS